MSLACEMFQEFYLSSLVSLRLRKGVVRVVILYTSVIVTVKQKLTKEYWYILCGVARDIFVIEDRFLETNYE